MESQDNSALLLVLLFNSDATFRVTRMFWPLDMLEVTLFVIVLESQ